MSRPRARRLVSLAVAAAAGAILVAALLLPGAVLGASPSVGPAGPASTPTSSPWATYPSGGIQVIFPSTLPQVDLVDGSNASMGATLQVAGILELVAGGLPHPTVVAAAFPMAQAGFNSTRSSDPSSSPLAEGASLEVHSVGASLWSSAGVSTFLGATIGSSSLFLNYTVLPSGAGLAIQWSVLGWPWVAGHDLLALELHLALTPSSGVTPCTGPASPGALPAACATTPIPSDGAAWDPTITSVVAHGPGGASASLAWNSSTTTPGRTTSGMVVGTFASTSSDADVVLATPAAGASHLSGSLAFSLFPPPGRALPTPPEVLRGALVPYLAVAIGSAVFAGVGVLLYRRRERATRDEL